MASHGGKRAGAGRKIEGAERRTELARVPLDPSELAELLGAAGDRPLAEYLRNAGLAAARK